jgi:hypothetical protein
MSTELKNTDMQIGGRYNWRNQPERLVYLGRNWSGYGYWHQFAKVEEPHKVWCEVLDDQIASFEASKAEHAEAPFKNCDWCDTPGACREHEGRYCARKPTASAAGEREAFEAAAREEWDGKSIPHNAWIGWQLRAALASKQEAQGGQTSRPDTVKIPTGEDEAALMALLGLNWLERHAPARLRSMGTRAPTPATPAQAEQAEAQRGPHEPLAISSAPEHIWLDLGFDPWEEDAHFSNLREVTWSEDNATGHGIKYVRATPAQAEQKPMDYLHRFMGKGSGIVRRFYNGEDQSVVDAGAWIQEANQLLQLLAASPPAPQPERVALTDEQDTAPVIIAPHPALQHALFCYATGTDGAAAILLRGWDALVAQVEEEVACHPDSKWREFLADLDEWQDDGWGVPHKYTCNFEDGYMSIYTISEKHSGSVGIGTSAGERGRDECTR